MQRVWQGSIDILRNNDRDWKQQLPRDINSDEEKCNGRAHVRALLDWRATSSQTVTFIKASINFLEFITHPSLVDCLAVDEFIDGIYSFIGEGNGTRAISFFQRLCTALITAREDNCTSISSEKAETTLLRLVTALCEFLYRDR